MELNDPLVCAPAFEEAIDLHPLRVTPDTLLVEAIALMSQTRGKSCLLPSLNTKLVDISKHESRSSCVLVMQESQLLGIFTERDIVGLTATGMNFEGVKIAEVMTHPVITLNEANFQDIFAALFLFRRYRIRHLPILREGGQLIGVVSPESIRQVLRPANLLKLRRVLDVMSKQVIHAPMTTSVLRLAQLMAEYRVSCIVITQEDAEGSFRPVGIVTERDIVQFQSLELEIWKIQALDVMSTPLFLLSPEDSLWIAHQEMQRRRVRRLVVSWNWGRGLGIVTQTSLLRVFDPMEMYGVIETLQRSFQELEAEKVKLLELSARQPEKTVQEVKVKRQRQVQPLPLSPQQQSESLDYCGSDRTATAGHDWESFLCRLQVCLESLIDEPELSPELRQRRLNSALADIERMRKLV